MLPGNLARAITNCQSFSNSFLALGQSFVQPAVEIETKGHSICRCGVL